MQLANGYNSRLLFCSGICYTAIKSCKKCINDIMKMFWYNRKMVWWL